jgi:hypothetical protein
MAVIGFWADEVGEKRSKAAIGARINLMILIFFRRVFAFCRNDYRERNCG